MPAGPSPADRRRALIIVAFIVLTLMAAIVLAWAYSLPSAPY
jgi:hypothetical protein